MPKAGRFFVAAWKLWPLADCLTWMEAPPAAARELLRTYPADGLHLVPTGYDKMHLEAA